MRVLVPFDSREPKTRLAPVLDMAERRAFARAMLDDVLEILQDAGHDPEVLATAPIDCPYTVGVDSRPLTVAVNDVLDRASGPIAVVMADLALSTTDALDGLFEPDTDIVIAPGLGGGTNALVIRHPDFRVDYHGVSYRDHCEQARECEASFTTVDSFRLAVDIDEPVDLAELLLHGTGNAVDWLREAGFELDSDDGRCLATRKNGPD